MAREYANIRLSVWDDDDFRDLPGDAQHLYFILLTSPTLSYCGVADWRPGRIAGLISDWDTTRVITAASTLFDRLYVLVDVETEEALVRSFVRHDGLMGKPRLAVSMVNAHRAVASRTLRGVVVHELARLRADQPDLKGWQGPTGGVGVAVGLSEREGIDPATLPNPFPAVSPPVCLPVCQPFEANASGQLPGVSVPPTTAPATATGNEENTTAPRKRGTRIPDDFTITDDMRTWAAENVPTLNLAQATVEFLDYWRGVPGAKGTKLDWPATWRNRMREIHQRQATGGRPLRAVNDGPPRLDQWRQR